ncbi:hypothetical protein [Mucilaginibacter sp.]|jgi:hypothetical protein|uniref:hypothetical protein n=1 Tax=Mucilaginibacter sp. TaxID=1882438 RepID=UPI003561474C
MKKFNYLFYILLCYVLISCGGSSPKATTEKKDSVGTKTANITAAPDTSKFTKEGNAKFFFDEIIDVQTAHDMIDLYKVRRKDLIDKTYHINDTRAISFDLVKMQTFIKNVSDAGGVGVRIYLGVYPSTGKYPGQTTIVAIGVKSDGTDILRSGSLTQVTGLDPYNHGNLCPPGVDCVN